MKNKSIILWILALYSFAHIQAQSTNYNYILTRTMTNESGTTSMDRIEYFDGRGRPLEVVEKQKTPAKKDLISDLFYYDPYGRIYYVCLPGPSSESSGAYTDLGKHLSVIRSLYNENHTETYFDYEDSFLFRKTYQKNPGTDWSQNSKAIRWEHLTTRGEIAERACPLFSVEGTGINA
ncbi:MAG: DUF6443 domain-containing protein, partial [Odoribacter sp.]|nr:DUF6443 domain-containing protein [Odoribacter sp.]